LKLRQFVRGAVTYRVGNRSLVALVWHGSARRRPTTAIHGRNGGDRTIFRNGGRLDLSRSPAFPGRRPAAGGPGRPNREPRAFGLRPFSVDSGFAPYLRDLSRRGRPEAFASHPRPCGTLRDRLTESHSEIDRTLRARLRLHPRMRGPQPGRDRDHAKGVRTRPWPRVRT
jgi:hypothetical protein